MPSVVGPTANEPRGPDASTAEGSRTFPPVSRQHIINCSYDQWYPRYRSSCLPSCIIPLPADFVEYLGEDGIILADDDEEEERPSFSEAVTKRWRENLDHLTVDIENQSLAESSDDEETSASVPPNQRFPVLHKLINEKIQELGGSVVPKLNWSAPKDAKWISRHPNSLECTNPNDIYILLKSSSFVSHDLDSAFDGCTPSEDASPSFSHVLVLRPFFSPHPSLEFRCFVKQRTLIGATPRDLNFYPFLLKQRGVIMGRIEDFFEKTLRLSFADDNFIFDVYIPNDDENADGLGNACLVDINPWAPRTDTLLWVWDELLDIQIPKPLLGPVINSLDNERSAEETTTGDNEGNLLPELRLVEKDDPAAYNFGGPPYSAHKLPKDVVDASTGDNEGLGEFLTRWKDATEKRSGET